MVLGEVVDFKAQNLNNPPKQNKSTNVDLKNQTPADAKPVLYAGTGI